MAATDLDEITGTDQQDAFARRNLLNFFDVRFGDDLQPQAEDPGEPVLSSTIHSKYIVMVL